MPTLDLDDLPPKIAALLQGLSAGEALKLVQHGVVVGRLVADTPAEAAPREPDRPPEQEMKEVFENFRAAIEDEF
jgi:antitoxin (DNA-binding transcriptional repressor) of toxin-antitoxin stability system